MYELQKQLAEISFSKRIKIALARAITLYSRDEMFEYALQKSEDKAGVGHGTEESRQVSRDGFKEAISAFFGDIGEFSASDIENLYTQVDGDGSGLIDRKEFDLFLDLATKESDVTEDDDQIDMVEEGQRGLQRQSAVRSNKSSMGWVAQAQLNDIFGREDAMEYCNSLSVAPGQPLKNWSIFYCGASGAIEQNLKTIKEKYGLGALAVEKFDW